MDNWGWNLTLLAGIIILELFSLVIFYRFHGIHHKECGSRLNDDAHFPPNIQDGALCLKPIPYQWGQNYHYIPEKNMWFLVGPQWKSPCKICPSSNRPILGPPEFPPQGMEMETTSFRYVVRAPFRQIESRGGKGFGSEKNRGKKAVSVWLANVFLFEVFFFQTCLGPWNLIRIFCGGWFFSELVPSVATPRTLDTQCRDLTHCRRNLFSTCRNGGSSNFCNHYHGPVLFDSILGVSKLTLSRERLSISEKENHLRKNINDAGYVYFPGGYSYPSLNSQWCGVYTRLDLFRLAEHHRSLRSLEVEKLRL